MTTLATTKQPRPESCKNCNPHGFRYVINNPSVCSDVERGPFLLMLIPSAHKKATARAVIRDTWADVKKIERDTKTEIRRVFLFGASPHPVLNELVAEEAAIHKDVIVEDFVDVYENLTIKSIMGLKWAAQFCGHAKYVLKVDIDMFVNTYNLLRYLRAEDAKFEQMKKKDWWPSISFSQQQQQQPSTFAGGRVCQTCSPIREPNSKWYVSLQQYHHPSYPPIMFGPSYVVSGHVAKSIYEASKDVPFFYLEDVYVTGLVGSKALGLTLVSIPHLFNFKKPFVLCYFVNDLISSHQYNPGEIRQIWNWITSNSANSVCSRNDTGIAKSILNNTAMKLLKNQYTY